VSVQGKHLPALITLKRQQ